MAPWPSRLTAAPPRLADFGYSNEMFEKDTVINGLNLLFFLWLVIPCCLETSDTLAYVFLVSGVGSLATEG